MRYEKMDKHGNIRHERSETALEERLEHRKIKGVKLFTKAEKKRWNKISKPIKTFMGGE